MIIDNLVMVLLIKITKVKNRLMWEDENFH